MAHSTLVILVFLLQNLKDQILTTNVWIEHVSIVDLLKRGDWFKNGIFSRNGMITNFLGSQRSTVVWRRFMCHRSTYGCQTSYCTIMLMEITLLKRWPKPFCTTMAKLFGRRPPFLNPPAKLMWNSSPSINRFAFLSLEAGRTMDFR